MYILGIYNTHNSTAAILKDGEVLACASEERFTGIKNFYGFPKNAIDYCLKEAGISSDQLDLVVIPYKYGAPIHSVRSSKKDLSLNLLIAVYKVAGVVRRIWGDIAFRFPSLLPIGQFMFRFSSLITEKVHMGNERQFVASHLKLPKEKVICVDHHLSHAASAYYCSPYNQKKALVLTIDGEGDFNSATVNIFDGDKYQILAKTPRESSLGYIYAKLTEFLGMKSNEHEYKVMGLAPYAKADDIDRNYNLIKDIIYFDPDQPLMFQSKFNTVDTDKYLRQKLTKIRFDILSGMFQRLVEEKITEWVKSAIKYTKLDTLTMAGGVVMNIKANQKIVNLPEVREIFIMPSAADESTPIGACFLGFLKLGKGDLLKNSAITNIYWGTKFSEEDTEKAIKKKRYNRKFQVYKSKNIEQEIAKLLASGKIVARVSGRMEFGARALGNRSILANPSILGVVKQINEQIKGRDFWMPFAPSILWERMEDYVVNPKKLYSPFMMIGFDSTDLAKKELASALHPADQTLRPQLLKEEVNPAYYKIIKEFEKLTGIGGVLNTSFNLHGMPIAKGPEEALFTLENSGLEYLAIDNYLISKAGKKIN